MILRHVGATLCGRPFPTGFVTLPTIPHGTLEQLNVNLHKYADFIDFIKILRYY